MKIFMNSEQKLFKIWIHSRPAECTRVTHFYSDYFFNLSPWHQFKIRQKKVFNELLLLIKSPRWSLDLGGVLWGEVWLILFLLLLFIFQGFIPILNWKMEKYGRQKTDLFSKGIQSEGIFFPPRVVDVGMLNFLGVEKYQRKGNSTFQPGNSSCFGLEFLLFSPLPPRISANRRIQAWNLIFNSQENWGKHLGKLELAAEGAPGVFRSRFCGISMSQNQILKLQKWI